MAKIPIIGVTGATGAGKGLVCKILAERGAYVIDADAAAHRVIKKPRPAYNEILAAFPQNILDENGEIIRQKLAELVFADQTKLNLLTEITHKYIIEEILAEVASIRAKPQNSNSLRNCTYTNIIIDAPLLIESGLHKHCDKVFGIVADDHIRMERIMRRDGLSRQAALNRLNKQTPRDVLAKHAQIIENNGSEAELREKLKEKLNGY